MQYRRALTIDIEFSAGKTGKVISSGGISAGIDMALTVVGQTLGVAVAQETANCMEYDWKSPI